MFLAVSLFPVEPALNETSLGYVSILLSILRRLHAREDSAYHLTVIFYGVKYFLCKTAQSCATRRESEILETPSVRNSAQSGENARKNFLLNYKSAALNQLSYAGVPIRKLFSAS
jgi:hypothetical protein